MLALSEQVVANGLLAGCVYIVMALGFTLVFGIMRIVNFAHGEFYMIGAFGVLGLYGGLGCNFYLAVALGAIMAGVVGAGLERTLFRPMVGDELGGMIMSLAVAIILQSVALMLFGAAEQSLDRPVTGVLHLHDAVLPLDRASVSVCALVLLAGFYWFLKRTRLGLAMQAVAQDRDTAGLMGVEAGSTYLWAFAIAAGLAGAAGGLMAPIYTVSPYMGDLPLLKAFVVVILGGLGSVPGAVVGSLLIGLSESVFATLFDATAALIASFGIVLLVVVVRPSGLLGRAAR